MPDKKPAVFKITPVCCAMLALLLSACGGTEVRPSGSIETGIIINSGLEQKTGDPDSDNEIEDDSPVEIVEAPELPPDDGIALSLEEKIALGSIGDLDRRLSAGEKSQVERHFKQYLHRQRAYFQRCLERGEPFIPHIKQVFKEMGIPEEIAYLAVVESGFNSHARSRVGATGMWQFMSYTGKRYGLTQNNWVDERRDPFKATRAAGTYLLQLYEQFGDWHLAIAAYNAGEGKIYRALQHTGADGFFDLCRLNDNIPQYKMRLRSETQQYVPRLLAVTKIMRNLELLGFQPPDPAKAHRVTELKVGPGTDLAALARNSGLKWEEFKTLNPSFRKAISSPSGYSTAYVPESHGTRALAWLARPEAQRFAGWQQYKVRSGDSLYVLSRRHGISVDVLKQANGLKGNTLRAGRFILVPSGKSAPAAQTAQKNSPAKNSPAPETSTAAAQKNHASSYTVRKGDTLYSIARKHGLSVAELQKANGLKGSSLSVGQKLRLASASRPATVQAAKSPTVQAQKRSVVVRRGDTLYSLARNNNTNVKELARLNGIRSNSPIYPGQKLILPN